ncbi:MAG: mechanosensitive ion channel [Thermodesulfobacteriota bacterium]|nr:mechanosensitive ion channel [Thermodesulfobacteriota bacterium]
MEPYIDKGLELIQVFGVRLVLALLILIAGRWVAAIFQKVVKKIMDRRGVDATISSFVSHITYFLLLAFFVIAALGKLGIQTASFVAVIGAAGLAIGLALQGSLANFAAGFLMIIFRPFKVGDLIEGAGVFGAVERIQIFTTQLKTPDNKTIIIPNAKLTDDNIINWSMKGVRRVDMVFGIGYGDDIDKARQIIADVLATDSRILEDPAPQIAVSNLGDSSVDFVVRPWVRIEDYWGVYFNITELVKKAFDEKGVSIPFPQRDVHMYQHTT